MTQVSPSVQGPPTGTNIWTGTPETSPEAEPPKQKRAKRESGDEELEEGEIRESSDEEEEEDNEEKESCVGAKSCANDIEGIKDASVDTVGTIVDDRTAKRSDECVKMDFSASPDDKPAASESAEVGMTKTVEELEPVRSPSLSG